MQKEAKKAIDTKPTRRRKRVMERDEWKVEWNTERERGAEKSRSRRRGGNYVTAFTPCHSSSLTITHTCSHLAQKGLCPQKTDTVSTEQISTLNNRIFGVKWTNISKQSVETNQEINNQIWEQCKKKRKESHWGKKAKKNLNWVLRLPCNIRSHKLCQEKTFIASGNLKPPKKALLRQY